jgi:hypothetical protein
VKETDLREILRKASKNVCTSTVAVSPDHLSPAPSTSTAVKTPEHTERTLMTLNQQIKEISKWNTPLVTCINEI